MNGEIYNLDDLEVEGLHDLEYNSEKNINFRWSKNFVKIKSKCKNIKTLVLKLNNILSPLKIYVINNTCVKSINVLTGQHYLYIPTQYNEEVLLFIDVTFIKNDFREYLGIIFERIDVSEDCVKYITLKEELEINVLEKKNNFEFINYELLKTTSVVNQYDKVTILNLNYNKENQYYNSSIFNFNNRDYVLTRNSKCVGEGDFEYYNKLCLYTYPEMNPVELNIHEEIPCEQYEDPRVCIMDDKLYVGCVNYQYNYFKYYHQKILVFDNEFKHIDNIHPIYGNNGKNAYSNKNDEKNWVYFKLNNKLMMVYSMYPHTIVEMDIQGNVCAEYKTYHDIYSSWKYGECRLGTPPILYNDEYHCFFHSHIPDKYNRRRYFMGYYKFSKNPPFNITYISENPILWGSEADDRILPNKSPLVVFPCGSILKKNKILVSFGLHDEKTAVLEYRL